MKPCVICGKEFKPANPRYKTCSKDCGKEHSRALHRKNYLKHRERIRKNYQNKKAEQKIKEEQERVNRRNELCQKFQAKT